MTQPSAEPPVFVPTARPVARFVAGLGALSAVFGLLWWSGLFTARLGVSVTNSFDRATNTGQAQVTIHNTAPLAATLRRVTQAGPWVQISAVEPNEALRLRAGATTRITVRYAIDCAGYTRAARTPAGATGPDLALRTRITGYLGGDRWLGTEAVGLPACS